MDQRCLVIPNDLNHVIDLRICGPKAVIPKDKKNTTKVRPNQPGTTLAFVLEKLKIKLENPNEWEIEALRHRTPAGSVRMNLCYTVKDVLMHYRRKVRGHFCFHLVRRRHTVVQDRRFVHMYANSDGMWNPIVRSPVNQRPSRTPQLDQSNFHAPSEGLNNGSGLEAANNVHHRSQQPLDRGTLVVGWVENEYPQTEESQVAAITGTSVGASKVNGGRVQHASVARFSGGANILGRVDGNAKVNGNLANVPLEDKLKKRFYLTGVAVLPVKRNSKPYNEGDITARLQGACKINCQSKKNN